MIPAFLIPALIGGGLGALTSKKPLKGALLGAGMGAAGGALAPGLLGGAAASGGASAALGPVAGGEVAMGAAIPGLEQYASGYTAQGLLGAAGGAAKTAAPYAQIAMQSGLLGGGQEQPIASPVQMPQVQASTLPQLSQQIEQSALAQQQADDQRRQRRLSLLGGM